ncbi:MAG: glucosidase, partial [Planctomycetota bacterium]
MTASMCAEDQRLLQSERREQHWHRWGPYLSERQWGTVREDYSDGGDATWSYLPHDHARSRAYRWGEDGLLGMCDGKGRLCFTVALWNGRDPILKERLFGVTGPEGNHGEDVKECYYYLDSTPTHSYMKALYKYPQARFPYEDLVQASQSRNRNEPEFELIDTGAFEQGRYFDVEIEYAKGGPNDVLIKLHVSNRGPEPAVLHVLPQLFFRNTWTWKCTDEGCTMRPSMKRVGDSVRLHHETLGEFWFSSDEMNRSEKWKWLFTDNETNTERHPGLPSESDYWKDAFHRYVVEGAFDAVNPNESGTKCASYGMELLGAGETKTVRLRLTHAGEALAKETCGGSVEAYHEAAFGDSFEQVFRQRQKEADDYYQTRIPDSVPDCRRAVMRQAYAGLMWTKQFYHYVVDTWLEGDSNGVSFSEHRKFGRNSDWRHLFNRDVISMPDKWEYPW